MKLLPASVVKAITTTSSLLLVISQSNIISASPLLRQRSTDSSTTEDCTAIYTDLTGASANVYRTQPVWEEGKRGWCYPFADRTSAVDPDYRASSLSNYKVLASNQIIFVVYPDGTSAGAPIVGSLPCKEGYSDAWDKRILEVPFDIKKDAYRDLDSIESVSENGAKLKKQGYFNFPIVTPGSTLEDISGLNAPEVDIHQAWFGGKKVFYFDFGPISQPYTRKFIEASGAIAVFSDDENSIPIKNGFDVISPTPSGMGYSGFFTYRSADTTGSPYNYLRFYSNFSGPDYVSYDRGLILNCPIVAIEQFVYKGDPPKPKKVGFELKPSGAIPPAPPKVDLSVSGRCFDVYLKGGARDYFTAEGVVSGKKFGCWNIGLHSSPAVSADTAKTLIGTVLQPVYESGEPAGVPIFGVLPCQSKYSDVNKVLGAVVPDATPFNFFKDFASLKAAATSSYVISISNYPIVEPNSRIGINPADVQPALEGIIKPSLKDGFYQGQPVQFFDFGKIPDLTPNTATIDNGKVAFPFKDNGAGNSVLYGDPIFDIVDGDAAYTGFYGVSKFESKDGQEVSSYAGLAEISVKDFGKVLNCPTAYFL
ncbi:hypothetical protein HDU97_007428 [Phlyctochytrium planicorne]|nr:hypothetical protein HDU97_007428 [Phlyctochytrium planicorne]